jgi:hypothetical protein
MTLRSGFEQSHRSPGIVHEIQGLLIVCFCIVRTGSQAWQRQAIQVFSSMSRRFL